MVDQKQLARLINLLC